MKYGDAISNVIKKVKVCYSTDNKAYAVKIFKRIHSEEKNQKALVQEAGHLSQLK